MNGSKRTVIGVMRLEDSCSGTATSTTGSRFSSPPERYAQRNSHYLNVVARLKPRRRRSRARVKT